MLKNEREYHITKAQAKKFHDSLNQFEKERPAKDLHPRLVRAQRDAMQEPT